MRTRSQYYIDRTEGEKVFIVDEDNGAMSVTNDAEAVVEDICRLHGNNSRIIYRDSMGIWDELAQENGKFVGFKPYRK